MIDAFPERTAKWIWRGHIDFSTRTKKSSTCCLPSLTQYDASIFHMREYAAARAAEAGRDLAARDRSADAEEHGALAGGRGVHRRQFGIDVERPLLTQVSRFDPWKDPLLA